MRIPADSDRKSPHVLDRDSTRNGSSWSGRNGLSVRSKKMRVRKHVIPSIEKKGSSPGLFQIDPVVCGTGLVLWLLLVENTSTSTQQQDWVRDQARHEFIMATTACIYSLLSVSKCDTYLRAKEMLATHLHFTVYLWAILKTGYPVHHFVTTSHQNHSSYSFLLLLGALTKGHPEREDLKRYYGSRLVCQTMTIQSCQILVALGNAISQTRHI